MSLVTLVQSHTLRHVISALSDVLLQSVLCSHRICLNILKQYISNLLAHIHNCNYVRTECVYAFKHIFFFILSVTHKCSSIVNIVHDGNAFLCYWETCLYTFFSIFMLTPCVCVCDLAWADVAATSATQKKPNALEPQINRTMDTIEAVRRTVSCVESAIECANIALVTEQYCPGKWQELFTHSLARCNRESHSCIGIHS